MKQIVETRLKQLHACKKAETVNQEKIQEQNRCIICDRALTRRERQEITQEDHEVKCYRHAADRNLTYYWLWKKILFEYEQEDELIKKLLAPLENLDLEDPEIPQEETRSGP